MRSAFLLLALVMLALAVVFLPPLFKGSDNTPVQAPLDSSTAFATNTDGQSADNAAKAAPIDPELVLRQRADASAAAEALTPRLQALENRGVQYWGAADFADLLALRDDADQAFAERQYPQALARYQGAIDVAEAMLQVAAEVLRQSLAEGETALSEGNAEAASKAFEQALQVQADNTQAQQGLQRASRLNAVLPLLREGNNQEQAGELEEALGAFQQALALDPAHPIAQAGVARLNEALDRQSFQEFIAKAYTALNRDDFRLAAINFDQAARLYPDEPALAEGRASLRQRQQDLRIAELKQNAQAHEQNERWVEALQAYREALKLESSLAFARAGEIRSRTRLQLGQQLQGYIDDKERLYTASVREEAEGFLQEAQALSPKGPVLRQQLLQLARLLAKAKTPIELELRSDAKTEVLFYRVAKLGQFKQKSLEVLPGDYVIVGRRAGYQDVRLEFKLRPDGATVSPIRIVCTEKL